MNKIKKVIITALIFVFLIAPEAAMAAFKVANMTNADIYWKAENSDVIDVPSANPLQSLGVYAFFNPNADKNKNYTITFTWDSNSGCIVTYNETQGIIMIENNINGTCEKITPGNMVILRPGTKLTGQY